MKIAIGVNAAGRRIGQWHPRAKLTDAEVELLRRLRSDSPDEWTPAKLAEKFEVHVRTVHKVLAFERRCETPYTYKQVAVACP